MSDPGELAASFLHLAMIEPAGHCVYLNANGLGLIRPAKRMHHDHKKLKRPGHPRSGEPQRSDAAIHAHTCASEDWYPGKDRREGIPGVKLCPRLQGGIDKLVCPCHSITRLNKLKLRSFIPKAPAQPSMTPDTIVIGKALTRSCISLFFSPAHVLLFSA
ncbi:hypothetical protein BIY37_05510 [Candidatus Brocadia sapporoensis]|uniref:Uncharacterized protein n=1 Tax=Candidatus Brocadia sapporoensis TaxID=392547 RepID=A0A1V6M0T1_9BACT|nr:hypothetical protein [Candidatus Brocadia sapporoensis]MDG6005376.1 hypothetical protein [Candidatus Brocadia sp.]OQD46003.1 hypothetical protein BIY37_05510 [Candidatus Brocadia sapporoensis]